MRWSEYTITLRLPVSVRSATGPDESHDYDPKFTESMTNLNFDAKSLTMKLAETKASETSTPGFPIKTFTTRNLSD